MENEYVSLYSYAKWYNLEIDYLHQNSPFGGWLRGVSGILIDLVAAVDESATRRDEAKEKSAIRNEQADEIQKELKLKTLERYTSLQAKLTDPRLPEGEKKYIQEEAASIMNSQGRQNVKAGIRSDHNKVDIKV
jgi:hypothetical protein